jgi:hypothetical protein
MEITKYTHAAVVVSLEWRHLEAVKLFVVEDVLANN